MSESASSNEGCPVAHDVEASGVESSGCPASAELDPRNMVNFSCVVYIVDIGSVDTSQSESGSSP